MSKLWMNYETHLKISKRKINKIKEIETKDIYYGQYYFKSIKGKSSGYESTL